MGTVAVMRSRLLVLAAAGGLALVAGGCGTKTFKQDDLQNTLAEKIAAQAGGSADDYDVTCPDDAEVKKGKTFTCSVTDAEGNKETITATPTDGDGHFRWSVSNTLHVTELERQLVQQLSANAGADPSKVKVDCPSGIEARKGRKFDCTLTAPNGDKVRVVVTLTNAQGGYTATVPKDQ
jgi:hypothetical protein